MPKRSKHMGVRRFEACQPHLLTVPRGQTPNEARGGSDRQAADRRQRSTNSLTQRGRLSMIDKPPGLGADNPRAGPPTTIDNHQGSLISPGAVNPPGGPPQSLANSTGALTSFRGSTLTSPRGLTSSSRGAETPRGAHTQEARLSVSVGGGPGRLSAIVGGDRAFPCRLRATGT
jgi:hypothetical protein